MPGKYSARSEESKTNSRIDNAARRAAMKDLVEMYPSQFRFLVDGYKREMRREAFGDPEYRVTFDASKTKHSARRADGRFVAMEETK